MKVQKRSFFMVYIFIIVHIDEERNGVRRGGGKGERKGNKEVNKGWTKGDLLFDVIL